MEISIPLFLQHLSNGLLYKSIQYSRDAQLALATIWLWNFNTSNRLGLVVPVDELLPNLRPVLLKMIKEVNCQKDLILILYSLLYWTGSRKWIKLSWL